MCNSGQNNSGNLFFIFDEINHKTKPCLDLKNISDVLLIVDVMNFTKKNCIRIDGACSSRVHTSMTYLSNLLNPLPLASDEPGVNIDDLIKDSFLDFCPQSCCDCE